MEAAESRQLYLSLLMRLRGGERVPVHGQYLSLDGVFRRMAEMLQLRHFCSCYVFELVKEGAAAMTKQYDGNNKTWLIKNHTILGLHTLHLVKEFGSFEQGVLNSKWERVLFVAISLVKYWRPTLYKAQLIINPSLKNWITTMMCNSDVCPKSAVRLGLMHFLAMSDLESVMSIDFGRNVAASFMFNVSHLKLNHLLPRRQMGLLWTLRRIIELLHHSSLLSFVSTTICLNLEYMQVEKPERSMAYLVVLLGHAARRVLTLYHTGDLTSLLVVDNFMNILHILRILVATPPNGRMFEKPGLCQLAASAIIQICRCVVQTPHPSRGKKRLADLLLLLQSFFHSLAIGKEKGTLILELQRYHGRGLSFIAARMAELQLSVTSVPKPLQEEAKAVPEKFLDAKTRRLMEIPLRLVDTQQIVDRSTLLLMQLTAAETDPLTGESRRDFSYEVVPPLQNEIMTWMLHHRLRK